MSITTGRRYTFRNMDYNEIESEDQNVERRNNSFLNFTKRFKTGGNKFRIIYTCCIWFACLCDGIVNKQLGPVHLDIQERSHVTFAESSFFLTSLNVAFIVGCFIISFTYRRRQDFMMLFLICLGSGVGAVMLPWSFSLISAMGAYSLLGLSFGMLSAFGNTELPALWGKNMSFAAQIMYLSYTVGGIIGPLETALFLSTGVNGTSVCLEENNTTCQNSDEHSDLYKAFLISGSPSFLGVIFYIIMFTILRCEDEKVTDDMYIQVEDRKTDQTTIGSKLFGLVLFAMFCSTCSGATFVVEVFLPSFLVKQFYFSRRHASVCATLHLGSQGIGRLFSAWAIEYFNYFKFTFFCAFLSILTFLVIFLCAWFSLPTIILLITIALLGSSLGNLLPTITTFIERNHFPVTKNMSSLFAISRRVADIIGGSVVAYLMQKHSPLAFVYVCVAEVSITIVSLTAILFYTRCVKRKGSSKDASDTEKSQLRETHP